MDFMDYAQAYAARGWAVLPLAPKTKNQPLTTHGFKDASKEPSQVAIWWAGTPDANIAIAVEESGLLVADFDPRNRGIAKPGAEFDEALAEEYDDLLRLCEAAGTLSATTGSGGRHFLFHATEDRVKGKLTAGVDFKHNGYIVATPSIHPDTGEAYTWDDPSVERDVLEAPAWLLETAAVNTEPTAERKEVNPDDDRPGTRFNAIATMAEILEPAGWQLSKTEGETEFWCRPGKEPPDISATFNFEGSGLFYVFTSSTEFEPDRGYDKFGVYARLYHDGDLDVALQAIQDVWLPQRAMITDDAFMSLEDVASAPVLEEASDGYAFESAFAPDHFVSAYIRHASRQTDASPEYHEAAALALLSEATPLLRAQLAPYPGGLQTNLYLLMVGTSTTSRKSTAQNIAIAVLEKFRSTAVLPSRQTTESLIAELSGASYLPRIWLPDEFGMTIAEIGRREFLRGVEDLLLELYGGKKYVYSTKTETYEVSNTHLSVLGASTPESLALAGPTAMLGGLLPRFGIIFPRTRPPMRAAGSIDGLDEERRALVDHLRWVTEVTQSKTEAVFDDVAVAVLNEAESRLQGEGLRAARLPAMLYKVAALSAAGRGEVRVTTDDAESAVKVVDRWLEGARHLQPYLRRKADDIEFERRLHIALEVLDELGGKAPRWKIARRLAIPKNRLDAIQAALVDQAYITVTETNVWARKEVK